MSVLIIAECGVNHNGSEEVAYRLIDAAIAAKADVAKFQLYRPALLAPAGEKREMLERLLLPKEAYIRLAAYCKNNGIGFACTAFDADSLQWLLTYTKMEFVKISSGQWENEELLNAAHDSDLMVIQSVDSRKFHYKPVVENWHLLHVVPLYPTPPQEANLAILKRSWCSGLSDHSGDIYMPLAAVGLGAEIIECHITLDKNQDGPDHKASLEPHQFIELVRGIRAIEKGLA